MTTPPLEKDVAFPPRSRGATWGAAHLAWGIAIFLAMVYAAQQLPVDSIQWLERLAMMFFCVGLAWIALTGCRAVERGWRLRRPKVTCLRLRWLDLLGNLALSGVMIVVLARGEQSHLLAAGLDRLVTAIALIGLLSALLSLAACYALRGPSHDEPSDLLLSWGRFVVAVLIIAVTAIIELSRL